MIQDRHGVPLSQGSKIVIPRDLLPAMVDAEVAEINEVVSPQDGPIKRITLVIGLPVVLPAEQLRVPHFVAAVEAKPQPKLV